MQIEAAAVTGIRRDPVSVWFDGAARRLLARAYAARGQWVGVYVAPPTFRQVAEAARLGIFDLRGRDRGEVRWVRAMKRATYWNLRYYGRADRIDFRERRAAAGYNAPFAASLEWRTGKFQRRPGGHWGWLVEVKLHPGGQAASRAAARKGRSWVQAGEESRLDQRDWT